MESSSSLLGSSKRAKAPGIIPQVVHCLVDGCNADLNLCRDYHRRHKVCEVHSKTAKVTIGGREQRFCQQCSRFHSLVEFDEGKRSCRKRLDGHNRRRRKPQPDTVTRNNNPPLVQTMSGPRLLSFNSPSIASWSNIIKPENNETMIYNHQHHMDNFNSERPPPNSFSTHSFKGVPNNNSNQIQFLQGGNNLDPTNVVVDSDHALSLLSSGPTTREFGLGLTHVARPEQQPTVNDLRHYSSSGCLGQYSFGHERGKTAVSGAESSPSHGGGSNVWSTLNFPGMFQHEGEGSSASGSHQTLTFMWE